MANISTGPAPTTVRTALDGSTPTLAALLDAVRPGLVADTAAHRTGRQCNLMEVRPGWSYATHGRAMMVARANLSGALSLRIDVEFIAQGDARTFAAPAGADEALVLVDGSLGGVGDVAIVVPAGAVDHEAIIGIADALLGCDTYTAALNASATHYGRLVLILAEMHAAALRRLDAPFAAVEAPAKQVCYECGLDFDAADEPTQTEKCARHGTRLETVQAVSAAVLTGRSPAPTATPAPSTAISASSIEELHRQIEELQLARQTETARADRAEYRCRELARSSYLRERSRLVSTTDQVRHFSAGDPDLPRDVIGRPMAPGWYWMADRVWQGPAATREQAERNHAAGAVVRA